MQSRVSLVQKPCYICFVILHLLTVKSESHWEGLVEPNWTGFMIGYETVICYLPAGCANKVQVRSWLAVVPLSLELSKSMQLTTVHFFSLLFATMNVLYALGFQNSYWLRTCFFFQNQFNFVLKDLPIFFSCLVSKICVLHRIIK